MIRSNYIINKTTKFSRKTKSKRDSVKIALAKISQQTAVSKIDDNTAFAEVVELAQRKLLQQIALLHANITKSTFAHDRLPARLIFLDISKEACIALSNKQPPSTSTMTYDDFRQRFNELAMDELRVRFVCEMEGVSTAKNHTLFV